MEIIKDDDVVADGRIDLNVIEFLSLNNRHGDTIRSFTKKVV